MIGSEIAKCRSEVSSGPQSVAPEYKFTAIDDYGCAHDSDSLGRLHFIRMWNNIAHYLHPRGQSVWVGAGPQALWFQPMLFGIDIATGRRGIVISFSVLVERQTCSESSWSLIKT
jgi:hypothetical protein